jgi:hypothetical protein
MNGVPLAVAIIDRQAERFLELVWLPLRAAESYSWGGYALVWPVRVLVTEKLPSGDATTLK